MDFIGTATVTVHYEEDDDTEDMPIAEVAERIRFGTVDTKVIAARFIIQNI